MVPPLILPLRYLEYAGVAKTHFRPSTLLLALPLPLPSLFLFCCSVGDGGFIPFVCTRTYFFYFCSSTCPTYPPGSGLVDPPPPSWVQVKNWLPLTSFFSSSWDTPSRGPEPYLISRESDLFMGRKILVANTCHVHLWDPH